MSYKKYTLITTLSTTPGYTAQSILLNPTPIDNIVLLAPKPLTKAVEIAYQEILALTYKIGLPQPKLYLVEAVENPSQTILEILHLVKEIEKPQQVVLDIQIAPPQITLATITALLIYYVQTQTPTIIKTGSQKNTTINIENLYHLLAKKLPPPKERIAKILVEQGPQTITQLAKQLNYTQRTIEKHIAWLRKRNYITKTRYTITPNTILKTYYKAWIQNYK